MSINLWPGYWEGKTPKGHSHQRSREIVRPTGNIMRGIVPSRKTARPVHHEGMLELDAIYMFEMSPMIATYGEQARQIQYPDGGTLKKYTPDFELVLTTGEVVWVEVKPTSQFEHKKVAHQFRCIEEHFARSGKSFTILTEAVLQREPRQSNLRWLYHQLPRFAPTSDALRLALDRYRDQLPLPIREAVALFGAHGIHPFSLLMTGALALNLEQAVTDDTLLHLAPENDDDWFHLT